MADIQCAFDKRCRTVPSGDMCPRHELLTKELGAKQAVRVEYGVNCYGCGKMADESTVATCKHCTEKDICKSCRDHSQCCRQKSEELEEEAESLEEQAEELRSDADDLKARFRAA